MAVAERGSTYSAICTKSSPEEHRASVTRSLASTAADRFHHLFQPEGSGFDSRSSRHVGTLGKSLTHSCLWRFGVKLRHSIRAVSGALLSRSGLEEALYKWSE